MTPMTPRPPHPGRIVFVDTADGSMETHDAAEVPETIAFAELAEGSVPVVRIEITVDGDERRMHAFDAQGRLVATTTQVA